MLGRLLHLGSGLPHCHLGGAGFEGFAGRGAVTGRRDALDQGVLLLQQPLVAVVRNEVDLVDHRHTYAVAIGQSETAAEDLLGKGLGREPAQRDDDTDCSSRPTPPSACRR